MSKHIRRALGAVVVAVLVTFLASAPVLAADLRGGDKITVPGGEEVDDDLYAAGQTITTNGDVKGDLWAAANSITANGAVDGSFVAVGQTIAVNGNVGRATRLAGETLSVAGDIDGDLIAFGSTLNVATGSEIHGDLLLWAGTVRIDGPIEGDVRGGGGEVTIAGRVRGDVELKVDRLVIAPTASIEGDLAYTSESEADIQSGAHIRGTTDYQPAEPEKAGKGAVGAGIAGMVGGKFLAFLMILVLGIIIILAAPRRVTSMADSIRTSLLPSVGWGAVILFATPLAAIMVCFTVIGIPVGLITLTLYAIAVYLSQLPVGLLIGRLILRRSREIESKGLLVGALALGLAILMLVRLIPYVGFWVGLATVLFGLGSLVVLGVKSRRERQQPTPA